MLHELLHSIQPELGLITATGQNAHLDTVEGRVWLRLEWRALARALGQSGEDRQRAVSDAAAFRLARRAQFANAAENERVEEIREGLAQYTGWPRPNSSRRSCSKPIQPVWRTGFFSIPRRRIGGAECAATPISGRC